MDDISAATLGPAFGAFYIWLTIRIINRREDRITMAAVGAVILIAAAAWVITTEPPHGSCADYDADAPHVWSTPGIFSHE
jgi:hypothetical protein